MVEIHTLVPHRLGRAAALDRMHQMAASLSQLFPQQVHQVRSSWQDNKLNIRFAAYGFLVQWDAVVLDEQVALVGQIPDAARTFKGKIEQAIVARLEVVLGESTSHHQGTSSQATIRKVA